MKYILIALSCCVLLGCSSINIDTPKEDQVILVVPSDLLEPVPELKTL